MLIAPDTFWEIVWFTFFWEAVIAIAFFLFLCCAARFMPALIVQVGSGCFGIAASLFPLAMAGMVLINIGILQGIFAVLLLVPIAHSIGHGIPDLLFSLIFKSPPALQQKVDRQTGKQEIVL
jgi:hypothetical protein